METAKGVKVVVVGEAGSGKTSFVQAVSGKAVRNPQWTVGCSVETVMHPHKAGTTNEIPYFIELWDVGGSRAHECSRHVFYENVQGVILVFDLTNRKSSENLPSWLNEVCANAERPLNDASPISLVTSFDTEQQAGRCVIPLLVVGSKLDLCPSTRSPNRVTTSFSNEFGGEEMHVDCRENIGGGSTNGLKLARFFDKIIDSAFITHYSNDSRRRKII